MSSEEEEYQRCTKRSKISQAETIKGLYLETVDRLNLDFDFEKLCSVSLNNLNVYGCLTCGKYFQGRSIHSPAYCHSMNEDHHVFINLFTLKIYILPENYQVDDPSLNDIKYVVKPTFTAEEVAALDHNEAFSKDLHGKQYLPGFVGLNNINSNDYINVLVQGLAHVGPLRDYFLLQGHDSRSELGTDN